MSTEGRWLTIMDYAVKNDVSLSTIRRYIKSNKVIYRKEHGRYLLRDEVLPTEAGLGESTEAGKYLRHPMDSRVDELEHKLNTALEQINELKMLVAIYEEKFQDS